jgi:membrane protease YdiL (CAAX protease family)
LKSLKTKMYVKQYVIYTYGLFLLLLLILGGIATELLHGTPLVMRWLTAITAWTPTYVFLLMFKKLYPNDTVRDFYKKAFSEKLNVRLIITTTVLQAIIFASSVFVVSVQRGVPTINLLDLSLPTVTSALFFTLIQGATGEETGWRGYLLPVVEEKYGVVKGSLIVSLIWAFWHAPIWFLGTEYSGMALLMYIMAFVVCISSLGFIIGICYHQCKNLFVPVWIHFIFNFLGEMFIGSMLDLIVCYAVLYFITALGFWHTHDGMRKRSHLGVN